jgi:hypothetical protein
MTDRLQIIHDRGLGSVLYHPALGLDLLHPGMDLDRLLYICNRALERDLVSADVGELSELARILRVNWMVRDLDQNGRIIKPILCEVTAFNLTVNQGDTRLMAAEMCPQVYTAPVLVSVDRSWKTMFQGWTEIQCSDQLTDLLGFEPGCVIFQDVPDNTDHLRWIEFNTPQTQHHLHDENQRVRMILGYLAQQSLDFRFSRDWCRQQIDWSQYH